MEKRLLIALLLSFLVLAGWQVINPPEKPAVDETKEIVNLSENGDFSQEEEKFQEVLEETPLGVRQDKLEEKIEVVENEKLRAEFSNIGGSLTRVIIKEFDVELPLKDVFGVAGLNNKAFQLEKVTENSIEYAIRDKGFAISKEYRLSEDDYLIEGKIDVKNVSKMSKEEKINITGLSLDISRLDNDFEKSRDRTLLEYDVYYNGTVFRKASAFKFSKKEEKEQMTSVDWVGFRNRYFCAVIKPEFETTAFKINPTSEKLLTIDLESKKNDWYSGNQRLLKALCFLGLKIWLF